MLLQLPLELVQLILKYCTATSYIQAALSCRALYSIVLSSRDITLRHLETNPGEILATDFHLNTQDLFQLLRKRTVEILLNEKFTFDRTLYSFDGRTLNISACSAYLDHRCIFMALSFKDDDNVYLCQLNDDGEIEINSSVKCALHDSDTERIDIVKTAYIFNVGLKRQLGVIVRRQQASEPEIDDANTGAGAAATSPFAHQINQESFEGNYFLLLFSQWGTHSLGYRPSVCRLYEHDNFKVNDLAVTGEGDFVVSWEDIRGDGRPEVIFYKTSLDESMPRGGPVSYLRYSPTTIVTGEGMLQESGEASNHPEFPSLGPITGLNINDENQLLYTHRGRPIFGYYQNFDMPDERFTLRRAHRNYVILQLYDISLATFTTAIPFFATHKTYRRRHGVESCIWKYLSYATAVHPTEGYTMAYLLRSQDIRPATICAHEINLGRGRRLGEWEAVARLCDYPQSTSTLGCIFATSPKGTRVAVSNWDVLYVWPLNPYEVVEGVDSMYYPEAWRSEDLAIVELRPVVIRLEAICFKLMFDDEDTIVAMTDRGLMVWNLGREAQGKRIMSNINMRQVIPEEASSVH